MAMVGFRASDTESPALAVVAFQLAESSAEERFFSKVEMSAPEMKDLLPAPRRMITRISPSASNSAMISGTA